MISYVFYHYMSHDRCYDWLARALRTGEVTPPPNTLPLPPTPNPTPTPTPTPTPHPNQVGAVLIVSRFENLSTQLRALEARRVRAITLMRQPQYSARRTDHRQASARPIT